MFLQRFFSLFYIILSFFSFFISLIYIFLIIEFKPVVDFMTLLIISAPLIFMLVSGFFLNMTFKLSIKKTKMIKYSNSIMILICILNLVILLVNNRYNEFSQKRWLEHEDKRVYMIGDLIQNYQLLGMDITEIYSFLGEPMMVDNNESKVLTYYLGNERGIIRIDSTVLELEFDENEVISNYRVKTD
ncbi:hypothetical protein SAMN04488134_10452 [Amphibacillus marinus]|uniref:Uncharacterized protein n=2 Tax=Amphibacillus marinus TaxID=872970 RepID=A0A1H8M6R2_9BACI|nr:hypothetical protein SAMN04488134_10452 [Amphibacillus marinus]